MAKKIFMSVQSRASSFLCPFIATFPNQSEPPLAFIHRARSPQKPPAKLTPSRRRIHLAKPGDLGRSKVVEIFYQLPNSWFLLHFGGIHWNTIPFGELVWHHCKSLKSMCKIFGREKALMLWQLGLSNFKPTRKESRYLVAIFEAMIQWSVFGKKLQLIELEQISLESRSDSSLVIPFDSDSSMPIFNTSTCSVHPKTKVAGRTFSHRCTPASLPMPEAPSAPITILSQHTT